MKEKTKSIIIIICLASILFIPIGLALMWTTTKWKTKIKVILTSLLGVFYILGILFLLFFEPSKQNQDSLTIPIQISETASSEDALISTNGKNTVSQNQDINDNSHKKQKKSQKNDNSEERLPKSLRKNKGNSGRLIYSILFFLFMLFLIIWQNIRNNNKPHYENPYVDTSKYKLPLSDDAKLPMVHYLNISLNKDEKITFATQTNQKDNEGDFVITNQRVLITNKSENIEFPLKVLTAVSSVTDSVMLLTSGDRKYYIFMPESELKYALAVLRWCYKKMSENE